MSSLNEIILKMPGNTRITITNKANAADEKNARLISNVNPKIIVGVIMKEIDNVELEYFIRDWHWDKKKQIEIGIIRGLQFTGQYPVFGREVSMTPKQSEAFDRIIAGYLEQIADLKGFLNTAERPIARD
jgi:hypothetical protein